MFIGSLLSCANIANETSGVKSLDDYIRSGQITIHTPIKVSPKNYIRPAQPKQCHATKEEAVTCEFRHSGRLIKVGMAQCHHCVIEFSDGGKECTDGSQCMGACVLAYYEVEEKYGKKFDEFFDKQQNMYHDLTGYCAKNNEPLFGCNAVINNGSTKGVICRD